ncbi:sigma-70 family RNA polymerase sigma factor [Phytoactinopolyspora limicola]|uniref:sigma-70 family RNA polymerase sigma factor n=1 Tax=Phytoactinopolyspora limicola TaxID=2715536 RepID=UPI001409FD4E|nr:sigma-70 family RNA polymerase sigma factor [Phytoactinopolyspora limicola]
MAAEDALVVVAGDRHRALVGYAYLLTGDLAEAEDLVQEAIVRTFARSLRGLELQDAERYVRRAVLRLYLDGRRRWGRWLGIRHLVATRSDDRGSPAGPELTDIQIDVRRALADLPRRERACVVLRYFDDLTVPQIADRLDVSAGAVKRYLSQGVHRLQAVLGPAAPVDDAAQAAPDRVTSDNADMKERR